MKKVLLSLCLVAAMLLGMLACKIRKINAALVWNKMIIPISHIVVNVNDFYKVGGISYLLAYSSAEDIGVSNVKAHLQGGVVDLSYKICDLLHC